MTDTSYEAIRAMTEDHFQKLTDTVLSEEQLYNMPNNAKLMSYDQLMEWLKSREEAGRTIVIGDCEIALVWINENNPYRVPVKIDVNLRRDVYVRSPESRGWINGGDLTVEKERAARDRFEILHALDLAARDAYPEWHVDFSNFDYERFTARPRGVELIDWFVKTSPEKAGAMEAKVRAEQAQHWVEEDDNQVFWALSRAAREQPGSHGGDSEVIEWFMKTYPEEARAIEGKVRADLAQPGAKRDPATTPAWQSACILREETVAATPWEIP